MTEWTIGEVCSRPMGLEEAFMSNMSSLMNGATWLTAFVEVDFDDKDEAQIAQCLQSGWKQIGLENPTINARIFSNVEDPDNPRMEVVLLDTQEKLNDWADQTFVIDRETEQARNFMSPERCFNEKYSLFWLTKSSELVLHGPHAVNDSYGSFLLFSRLFELYGRADPKLVPRDALVSRLNKSTQAHLNCQPIALNSMEDCLANEFLGRDIPLWIDDVQNAGGLPGTKNTDHPELGGTHPSPVIITEFTEVETCKVVSNAKKHGCKVGEYIWAANVTALGQFPENDGKFYANMMTIDQRKNIANPPDACMHVIGWPIAIPITNSLEANVKWVRGYTARYLPLLKNFTIDNHPELDAAVAGWNLFNRSLPDLAKSQGLRPGYAQSIAPVGVIDGFIKARYQKLTVKRVNVCGLQTTPGAHTLWLTFNGRLNASYCYNSAFHDPADMQNHTENIKRILLDATV